MLFLKFIIILYFQVPVRMSRAKLKRKLALERIQTEEKYKFTDNEIPKPIEITIPVPKINPKNKVRRWLEFETQTLNSLSQETKSLAPENTSQVIIIIYHNSKFQYTLDCGQ